MKCWDGCQLDGMVEEEQEMQGYTKLDWTRLEGQWMGREPIGRYSSTLFKKLMHIS
jgi:hypothetical protein